MGSSASKTENQETNETPRPSGNRQPIDNNDPGMFGTQTFRPDDGRVSDARDERHVYYENDMHPQRQRVLHDPQPHSLNPWLENSHVVPPHMAPPPYNEIHHDPVAMATPHRNATQEPPTQPGETTGGETTARSEQPSSRAPSVQRQTASPHQNSLTGNASANPEPSPRAVPSTAPGPSWREDVEQQVTQRTQEPVQSRTLHKPSVNPYSMSIDRLRYKSMYLEQPATGNPTNANTSNIVPEGKIEYQVDTLLNYGVVRKTDKKQRTNDAEYVDLNLRFYHNVIPFRPDGEYVDNVHRNWLGRYAILDQLDTYIQWLFPIQEKSKKNRYAVPLREHEARQISNDPETRVRVVKSYRLMLDYYGMQLVDELSGKIVRASHWKDRYYHLKRTKRDHFRLTRIIKSLGELGFAFFQAPLVLMLLHEIFETHELFGILPSSIQHWVRAISHKFEREYVLRQFQERITDLEHKFERWKRNSSDNNNRYFHTHRRTKR
ncbi:uncharacterized protein LOC128229935 [Mya arenaria]|uniref:uncharacterized protein LOC128229935 n=1 Tax=Mya arenaria TaxID=6604 RepID=UPI0022E357FE|nr:uncharacterized protein LOC128229935 [Mya arenaria]